MNNAITRKLRLIFRAFRARRLDLPLKLEFDTVFSYDQYVQRAKRMAEEYGNREVIERSLIEDKEPFLVPGYCYVCRKHANFMVDFEYCFVTPDGRRNPNWRERLVCDCGLNNRLRASVHIFQQVLEGGPDDPIYIMEQTTPLFRWVQKNYRQVTGSEFLGDSVPYGRTDCRGIRNESATRLTFPDAAFKFILSFDVLEHVPYFEQGLRECLRCLKPGGSMLLSVPFDRWRKTNLVRAKIGTYGDIWHILPPEYHGDPLTAQGCLSFYTFGWELLDIIKAVGFSDAVALLFWSLQFGYLGHEQILFIAHKP